MEHEFFETGDENAPDSIKNRNGEVVLSLCKICGCAEASLPTECPGVKVGMITQDEIQKGNIDYINGKFIRLKPHVGANNMYDELIEIRNKVDKLIKEYRPEPEFEFEYVGEMYGKNGKYRLYLSPKHTEKILNWNEAKKYCKSLNAELPTTGELQYLYDNHDESFEHNEYWSSTENSSSQAEAYSYLNGHVTTFTKHNHGLYVRPVRRVDL